MMIMINVCRLGITILLFPPHWMPFLVESNFSGWNL